jgi:hypothetical protein
MGRQRHDLLICTVMEACKGAHPNCSSMCMLLRCELPSCSSSCWFIVFVPKTPSSPTSHTLYGMRGHHSSAPIPSLWSWIKKNSHGLPTMTDCKIKSHLLWTWQYIRVYIHERSSVHVTYAFKLFDRTWVEAQVQTKVMSAWEELSDTIIGKKGTGLNLKEAAKKGLPSKKRHCQTTQNTMIFIYEDT